MGKETVYGAIAEGGRKYYTDMGEVFAAAGNIQGDYNWLISAWNAYGPIEDELKGYDDESVWLTGPELTGLLERCPKQQWIWGVFSGFDGSISKEKVLKYPLPYADGYEGVWKKPLSIQHPLADIEIVPWDSTLVLFLANDRMIVERFRKNFLPNEDLLQYNANLG